MNNRITYLVAVLLVTLGFAGRAETRSIRLAVDATEAPRRILHATLNIPAKAGKLTLLYPKWIPGEHGPNGPISDLVGLKMTTGGKPLQWRRDDDNMFAFHLQVPSGADSVDVSLDFLLSTENSVTSELLDLSWYCVLLYPKGAKANELRYETTLRLPAGWKFGTALPVATQSSGEIAFAPVSLETLVDSTLIAGSHFRTIDLTPGAKPGHALDMVADSEAALEIKPDDLKRFSRLTAEAGELFGARHYRDYHFLLTLSDHVAHFGLEHHESSDNRRREKYLIDESERKYGGVLLPHELVHSWNGKYRRPAGLATPDFDKPMEGELLWVYEGLTDYLGSVLATRSGLWTNEDFRAVLALNAARLNHTAGRNWRPLSDTTVAAQLLYGARGEGAAWRRGTDFYAEGGLIWLEADVLIRQKTDGRKSLDDFCKKFHGGESGAPRVVPYTFEDVVKTMNEVVPHNWREFFHSRAYVANPRAPLGGIEGGGWRLTYTNTPPAFLKLAEGARKYTDLTYSIGLRVKEDGAVADIVPAMAADKAGLAPSMKLVAINGRRWNSQLLRTAIASAATNSAPIELLVENEEYFKTYKVDYHGGERYPQLERDPAKPDVLSDIIKPLTPDATSGSAAERRPSAVTGS